MEGQDRRERERSQTGEWGAGAGVVGWPRQVAGVVK